MIAPDADANAAARAAAKQRATVERLAKLARGSAMRRWGAAWMRLTARERNHEVAAAALGLIAGQETEGMSATRGATLVAFASHVLAHGEPEG